MKILRIAAAALLIVQTACGGGGGTGGGPPTPNPSPSPTPAGKISHIIVIFQENRTPDNLFHGLPGADIANSGLNSQGQTVTLQPIDMTAPYDLDHSHNGFSTEYANGNMNGFDQEGSSSCSTGCPPPNVRAYGYVPPAQVAQYFTLAQTYTFADRMFQSNEGPSFPAHQYIIAGTSAPSVGSNLLAAENPNKPGGGNTGGCDSPSGSLVKMIDPSGSEATTMYPCFDHPTLMDLLDAHGYSWKYYMGGGIAPGLWDAPDAISHIRNSVSDWANMSAPATNIFNDISSGHLANMSWVIPTAAASDHARSTDGSGPAWVASIVNAVGASPYWNSTAILVTWDDWGGWYDHVKPTVIDSYEIGFRVPLLVISPYARPAYVSHVQHEFGSILHFVESQYGLGTLNYADARSDDLSDCFNFAQTPIVFHAVPSTRGAASFKALPASATPPDSDL